MKRILSYISVALAFMAVSCKPEKTSVPLTADFEFDRSDVLVGEEVSFNALTTGNVTRWTWTFEGATPETSVLTQPKICWLDAGSYTVKLVASNAEESVEVVKEKVINVSYHSSVTADFEMDRTRAYSDQVVSFTNKSLGFPNNIKWTFTPKEGTPVVSTEANPALTFEPGLYTIKLEVSSPVASDVKELVDALLILDPYAVTAHIQSDHATTYTGGSIKFSALTEGPVKTYEWTFEGGTPATSTEEKPEVTYNTVGSYKVSLTVRNGSSSDTDEIEGYVHVIPGSDIVFMLPFDGDFKDYGPYGLHPSLYTLGGLEITFEEGNKHAQAARFPGGTKGKAYQVLLAPNAIEDHWPAGNELTVSWWSRLPAVSANEAVFAQGHCPGFDNSQQIWCRFQTGNAIRATAEQTTPKASATSTISNTNLQNNEWHNITLVLSNQGGDLVFYFDGVKQTPQLNKGPQDTQRTPYAIGCNLRWTNNAPAPENMYTGLLDDYVLYSKALSEADIKALYEVGQ